MKRDLILVKLGGAVITDKTIPYKAKKKVIERLAGEVKRAKKKRDFDLILGHGGGSFPHTSAKIYKTKEGFIKKSSAFGFCLVHNDAAALNRIVIDIFLKKGIKVFSVQPSSCILTRSSKIVSFNLKPILKLLEYGIIPVVYGDAVIDLKQGCTILSTEEILSYLAKKLKAKKITFGSKENGVYIKRGRKKEFLKELNKKNLDNIRESISLSEGIDVTGGMIHKVEESLKLAKLGFDVEIISESVPGNLEKSLLGSKVGTSIKW